MACGILQKIPASHPPALPLHPSRKSSAYPLLSDSQSASHSPVACLPASAKPPSPVQPPLPLPPQVPQTPPTSAPSQSPTTPLPSSLFASHTTAPHNANHPNPPGVKRFRFCSAEPS